MHREMLKTDHAIISEVITTTQDCQENNSTTLQGNIILLHCSIVNK